MRNPPDLALLDEALHAARRRLLAMREAGGCWRGELSSSALATATAVWALHTAGEASDRRLIDAGLGWLDRNRNADGGWGDTPASQSNIATTMLAWSALAADEGSYGGAAAACRAWLERAAGGTDGQSLAEALIGRYGNDRTFSAPILTMCALAGRLGQAPWRHVAALPFELAAMPHRALKWLRLPVVSYALPALIAIGQAKHYHDPPTCPVRRLLRRWTRRRTLRLLAEIQPSSGGFLEAAPLTSFVVMSLVSIGSKGHPSVAKGLDFIRRSARADGSWPIDTDLATWVTTLSVNALCTDGEDANLPQAQAVRQWLLSCQLQSEHPYTRAAAGGWGWTDLSGSVPDADDTAGALLALRRLGPVDEAARQAGRRGVRWLLDLQNSDGGMPTFCRGWGALPFDRSAEDLTAHAVSAWLAWMDDLPRTLRNRARKAVSKALRFLRRRQGVDGSFLPLWFGNERCPGQTNPTYGTARVLAALADAAGPGRLRPGLDELAARATSWLLDAQNADGGWGGGPGAASSIEETAIAAHALAGLLLACPDAPLVGDARAAVARAAVWLVGRTQGGNVFEPAPIGLYFAKLWYFEKLYPVIFTVAALGRIRAAFKAAGDAAVVARTWQLPL